MGGCGSGRHHGARKLRVESCLALDVNELRRKGALAPGTSGTLTWEHGDDAQASVAFHVNEAALTVRYQTAELRELEQHIALSSVVTAFGGSRAYFLCPGAHCGRRSSILYFAKGAFRCRHCHGLAYECQREDTIKRARRRADKLRARLNWPFRHALPTATRPKGMWQKTLTRLRTSAIAAELIARAACEKRLMRMIEKVDKRRKRVRSAGQKFRVINST